MKKNIILFGFILFCFAITGYGYVQVNEKYPRSVKKEGKAGEGIEYRKGIKISADTLRFIDEKEKENLFEKTDFPKANVEQKLVEITIDLVNETNQTQELSFGELYLETIGAAYVIDPYLSSVQKETYSDINMKLEAGEKKQCTYPVVLSKSTFDKRSWNHLEEQSYWLTFSEYPVKTKCYFKKTM